MASRLEAHNLACTEDMKLVNTWIKVNSKSVSDAAEDRPLNPRSREVVERYRALAVTTVPRRSLDAEHAKRVDEHMTRVLVTYAV